MSNRIRLLFRKMGRAKYISHLDLIATMRRAALRAGIKLKYSEGFNPHPYISVALPLPIGCGSICELMDIEPEGNISLESLPAVITDMLPEGIEVMKAYVPERKFREIAWVEISGELFYDTGVPQGAAEMLSELIGAKSIVISKKTKRGIADADIAPFITDAKFSTDNIVRMRIKVSAQEPTINTDDLTKALTGGDGLAAPDFFLFTREEVFDAGMNIFR